MNSQNIDADVSDITRKTGKKDFLQESNKKNTNHPNIVKIKKKKKMIKHQSFIFNSVPVKLIIE